MYVNTLPMNFAVAVVSLSIELMLYDGESLVPYWYLGSIMLLETAQFLALMVYEFLSRGSLVNSWYY